MEILIQDHEIEEAVISYVSEKLGYPYDKLIMEKPIIEVKNIPYDQTFSSSNVQHSIDFKCCFDQVCVKIILEVD